MISFLAQTGCGAADGGLVGLPTPSSIAAVTATSLTGTAGLPVSAPPSVKVTSSDGTPVSGVTVSFSVATGGGSVIGGTATTTSDGVATVGGWTLGIAAGSNTLSATAASLPAITFVAQGNPGSPAKLSVVTSPPTSAQDRLVFVAQPVVQLQDANGNAVAQSGVSVSVSITTGGGTLGGTATVQTGVGGTAAFTNLSIAGTVGARSLTFASSGLVSAIANVSLTAGPATTIVANGGSGQTATVGLPVVTPPSVKVSDADGNPVTGTTVTFAVASGAGSATGTSAATNTSGIAAVGSWALGSSGGANTLTASATGLAGSPVTFSAIAVAPSIMGLTYRTGVWEFIYANSEMGAVTSVALLPNLLGLNTGSTVDAAAGRYFFAGFESFTGPTRLYGIDTKTGAVLTNADVSSLNFGEMQYDAKNARIIALTYRTGVEEFVGIAPQTGQVTSIGFIAEVKFISEGSDTFDATNGRYYFLGIDSVGTSRIYGLDAQTGTVISRVDVGTGNFSEYHFDPTSGKIEALTYRTGVEELVSIAPQTGQITSLGFIAEVKTISQGNSAFDVATGRYLFPGGDNAGTTRLFGVTRAGSSITRVDINSLGINNMQVVP